MDAARNLPWLADAEERALSWIVTDQLPQYLAETKSRRAKELARTKELVNKRLQDEHDRLIL